MLQVEFDNRIRFIAELARRLHQYGTTAPRLENAINQVASRLELECNTLATPTSVILSFTVIADGPDALPRCTQVLRLNPGEVNLRRLVEVDGIAERVFDGSLNIESGLAALRAVRTQLSPRAERLRVLSYGIASATVAALFKGTWADVVVAGVLGLTMGLMASKVAKRPNAGPSLEVIAAFLTMLMASLISALLLPIHVNWVVIAALIVLLPGLSLTSAMVELSTQHLVAGTVRFMGAVAVLLKLAFGAVAGAQVIKLLALQPLPVLMSPIAGWYEGLALLAGSYAFAVLFQVGRRDFPLAMASSCLGYLCTRWGGMLSGPEFGVFVAGLAIGSAANLYARFYKRPGALVRLPGVIMLVPGTVGLRSFISVFESQIDLGLDTALAMIVLLASLVAGLLFGNLLVPPRRSI